MIAPLTTLAALTPVIDPLARLGRPEWLHALWAAPLLVALAWFAERARRAALRRFAAADLLPALTPAASPRRRWIKAALTSAAAALLALALAQPRFNPVEQRADRIGRDVVFIVDVSRSMLATDLAPSRLDRAKLWIDDLVASLKGDRVGLVAFAGAPTVVSPLTLDRAFFGLALEQLSTDSAPKGGTNIGDAIRKTLDTVFAIDTTLDDAQAAALPRDRDIILITDGEDQQSFPVDAARLAGKAGVRIIILGVGSDTQGATLPVADPATGAAPDAGVLRFGGEIVRSKMDPTTLAAIAAASPGHTFLNVGTATIDLEQVYADLSRNADRRVLGSASIVRYDEWFWALLIPAALILAIEPLITERRPA